MFDFVALVVPIALLLLEVMTNVPDFSVIEESTLTAIGGPFLLSAKMLEL